MSYLGATLSGTMDLSSPTAIGQGSRRVALNLQMSSDTLHRQAMTLAEQCPPCVRTVRTGNNAVSGMAQVLSVVAEIKNDQTAISSPHQTSRHNRTAVQFRFRAVQGQDVRRRDAAASS